MSEALILGGALAAVAAGVGVVYATRSTAKEETPTPVYYNVPQTRAPNPPGMAVPTLDTRYMSNTAASQVYQPAQQGLASWLSLGIGALDKLPTLVKSGSDLVSLFNSPPAVTAPPTGDAYAAQQTVQAGLDYQAFAEQYAATQVAIDAANQAAISYESGGALASDEDSYGW